jgi:hypothetical protein
MSKFKLNDTKIDEIKTALTPIVNEHLEDNVPETIMAVTDVMQEIAAKTDGCVVLGYDYSKDYSFTMFQGATLRLAYSICQIFNRGRPDGGEMELFKWTLRSLIARFPESKDIIRGVMNE